MHRRRADRSHQHDVVLANLSSLYIETCELFDQSSGMQCCSNTALRLICYRSEVCHYILRTVELWVLDMLHSLAWVMCSASLLMSAWQALVLP